SEHCQSAGRRSDGSRPPVLRHGIGLWTPNHRVLRPEETPDFRRLVVFAKVCQAVQHAHQKGIIHRDLKPSNILVAEHDGMPVPNIIDFGIAKATEGRLTDYSTVGARVSEIPRYRS